MLAVRFSHLTQLAHGRLQEPAHARSGVLSSSASRGLPPSLGATRHVPSEREEREARQLSLEYWEKFTQFGKGTSVGVLGSDVVAHLGLADAELQ